MNPIYIHKSDSTIFANVNKFLTFNLETELDLIGWQAKFILGWVEKTIDDISTKSFEIILGAEDTKQLRLGKQYGTIILTDSNGNIKTVTNTIPFEVTTAVVENEYQEIDLTIPESSGVDIKLKVGVSTVTSINGMTGDVTIDIPDISGLATKEELSTKQDKGDYALASDIPTQVSQLENDSDYATQTELTNGLTDYVKNTDYPTATAPGVVKLGSTTFGVTQYNGYLQGYTATLENYNKANNPYIVCKGTLENIKNDLVKRAVTTNDIELTDDEKTSARTWLGAVGSTDYATSSKGGVIVSSGSYGAVISQSTGYLYTPTKTLSEYNSMPTSSFIGKGTLNNVLTQYAKTVLTTEADYDALGTKDANTLYLIEEE